MCYPPIGKEKELEILNKIDKFLNERNKLSYDVRKMLMEINENFVVDFNQLKFSIKNDENQKYKFSEDLCTIFLNN